MKINFTDLSTGNPNEWLWLFGDGSSSVAKNPDHQYSDTGYFSVTLIAINNGCADTLLLPDYIHIKPPVAKFKYTNICSQPGHVVFTDMSIGADTWNWDFGDGTSSTMQNPVHDYAVSRSLYSSAYCYKQYYRLRLYENRYHKCFKRNIRTLHQVLLLFVKTLLSFSVL